MPGKVELKKVKKGKNKGQWRFVLKGDNGKNLSPNDTYHNAHDMMDVIHKYFPQFEVVDKVDYSKV